MSTTAGGFFLLCLGTTPICAENLAPGILWKVNNKKQRTTTGKWPMGRNQPPSEQPINRPSRTETWQPIQPSWTPEPPSLATLWNPHPLTQASACPAKCFAALVGVAFEGFHKIPPLPRRFRAASAAQSVPSAASIAANALHLLWSAVKLRLVIQQIQTNLQGISLEDLENIPGQALGSSLRAMPAIWASLGHRSGHRSNQTVLLSRHGQFDLYSS